MVYETLRDCLSNIRRDGVKAAYTMRCLAIERLTNVLIRLNIPHQDTRLTKMHVEFLFRMLNGTFVDLVYPELHPGESAESKLKRYDHSKEVAARCLFQLEKAYPGFLALEAGSLVQCMLQDSKLISRQDGHPLILLTATAVGNVCSQYQRQQLQKEEEENEEEEESMQAGQPIMAPIVCGDLESEVIGRSDRDQEDSVATVEALILAPEHQRGLGSVSDECSFEEDSRSCKSVDSCTDEQRGACDDKRLSEEQKEGKGVLGASLSSLEPSKSPTSTALPTLDSSSTREGSVSSDAQSSNYNVLELTTMPLLVSKDTICPELDSFALSKLLKKFKVPAFGNDGVCLQYPSYYVTDDVKQSLKRAISFFVSRATRGNAETIKVLASNLPCILESAEISPAQILSIANTLLGYGTSTLLRAVLSIHDQAPKLFGRQGSCKLVDRMFRLINELECPQDQKLDALTWILRLHASQRFHNRDALYLADCWRQLLLRPADSMQVALLKIKGLGSCLAVGIGEPSIVCHSVLLWNGFDPLVTNKKDGNLKNGRVKTSATKLRTMTYALRLLYHAIEVSDSNSNLNPVTTGNDAVRRRLRLRACVVVSAMVAIAFRPQLVPAVDSFLDSCDSDVSFLFLRAFSALLSGVDGQFELLREMPEDQDISMLQGISGLSVSRQKGSWTDRVKTAVLARASSLAGQLRGLTFALSFSNRPSSFALNPVSIDESQSSQNRVNVKTLRTSILAGMSKPSSTAQANQALLQPQMSPHQSRLSSFPSHAIQVIQMPSTFDDHKAMAAWLSAPATWEPLAPELLKQDLLAYRTLIFKCVSKPFVNPKGTLCALANYAWQYKEAHPSHALTSEIAAASVMLAICQKVALTYLPWESMLDFDDASDAMKHNSGVVVTSAKNKWTSGQRAISDQVLSVLDAMDDDGFPVSSIKPRVHSLVSLVSEESRWKTEDRREVTGQLLNDHLQIVVYQERMN
jgi:hypothetical protein